MFLAKWMFSYFAHIKLLLSLCHSLNHLHPFSDTLHAFHFPLELKFTTTGMSDVRITFRDCIPQLPPIYNQREQMEFLIHPSDMEFSLWPPLWYVSINTSLGLLLPTCTRTIYLTQQPSINGVWEEIRTPRGNPQSSPYRGEAWPAESLWESFP